jgi:hypothetical protein
VEAFINPGALRASPQRYIVSRRAGAFGPSVKGPFPVAVGQSMPDDVPNMVDDDGLSFPRQRAKSATELLSVQAETLGRATHAYRFERRQIEAFAEQINVDELEDFTSREPAQRRGPHDFRSFRRHAFCWHPCGSEACGGFLGQLDADTEGNAEFTASDAQIGVYDVAGDMAFTSGVS